MPDDPRKAKTLGEAAHADRIALVKRILEKAAKHLEGYAGGHYMAQSCADELRRDDLAKWIAENDDAR